jgi:hypothetical protein
VLNLSQLKSIIWMHNTGLALVPYPKLELDRLECHPKVSFSLRKAATLLEFEPFKELLCDLKLVVYPDFRETEWRIMSTEDVELYHGVDPDGILIRPAVLEAIPFY